ncbi:MAG: glycosyltransferase family 2 protein [Planctomycetota bacterium]|jgi:glycosyltransferase involved in cell wall biosynthesis
MGPRILVVIPAYNEENNIASVLKALRREAPDFDRVVVNDGSIDATSRIVENLGEKQILLSCNLGYGTALQTGMKYAVMRGYDVVVSIDSDGQHKAEDVPRLIHFLLESGSDMVIGSRFCDGRSYDSSIGRRVGQLLFSHLTRLLIGRRIYDTTSGFKAIRIATCKALLNGTFMDFHIEAIVRLSLLGFKIEEVSIDIEERTFGRSMYSFASFLHYPLKTIVLTIVAAMDVFLGRRTR